MRANLPETTSTLNQTSGVNLNLGTIGLLKSHVASQLGAHLPVTRDSYVALAEAHEGLPRPGRDLDCRVLRAPIAAPLVLLGAVHHNVGYYIICNVAERPAWTALKWAQKLGRLEMGFTVDGGNPLWSALHFDEADRQKLAGELEARKNAWRTQDDSWRDRLGLQVLSLPGLLAEVEPTAVRCTQHAAVLLSGSRTTHGNRVGRCLGHRLQS
jgi:hypothetical protein